MAGSTTSPSKLSTFAENGIEPYLIDIANPEVDLHEFANTDVLIVAIPSKEVEHMRNVVRLIGQSTVKKVVYVSSTSVYPNTNGVVTEETPTINSPLAQIEELFSSSLNFNCSIVRFGGLFGYDRQPGNFIRENRPVSNPEGYINFIHRDDCIGVIEQIILKDVWNKTFNACADEHPKRREFYTQEARKVGKPSITFENNLESEFKIIDSSKLKQMLGYAFIHPTLMDRT